MKLSPAELLQIDGIDSHVEIGDDISRIGDDLPVERLGEGLHVSEIHVQDGDLETKKGYVNSA